MTRLADLVQTSDAVAETRARLAKVRPLAERLAALDHDEIAIGAQYLSGSVPQGRLGIGYALLQAASDGPAAKELTVTIADVDRTLGEIAVMRGAGATTLRTEALRRLFARATERVGEFLIRRFV